MLPVDGRFHSFPIPSKLTHCSSPRGFTLVELLVVVAIILILFSVSLPSFLEAQVRDKVAKAKGDIRLITCALEDYYRDYGIYPPESVSDALHRGRNSQGLFWLTSPINYLKKVPVDIFNLRNSTHPDKPCFYETGGIKDGGYRCSSCLHTWVVFSRGPDMKENQVVSDHPHYGTYDGSVDSYSPTNGTTSEGDIFQYGGNPFWIGVASSWTFNYHYQSAMDIGLVVDNKTYLHRLPPGLR